MKASVEVNRVVKGLEDQIDSFEQRKLHDLKSVLLDFVTVELSFHTKALELLTKAYQDVAAIDEVKDLEVRRRKSPASNSHSRVKTKLCERSHAETLRITLHRDSRDKLNVACYSMCIFNCERKLESRVNLDY